MTLFEVYQQSIKQLKNPDVDEINVRILLCEVNELDSMSDFYIRKNENIRDLQEFNLKFERFLHGEPIQYILNKTSFFGLDLYVDKNVLIPRMETEEVVSFAIKKIKEKFGDKTIDVADVCCGSGCIGISLFKNLNINKVLFSDISKKALDVTKINASKNHVKSEFCVSNSLDYLNHYVHVVVSNPPYILNRDDVDPSVLNHEPSIALFADKQLSVYRKIVNKCAELNIPLVIFEIGYDLKEKLIQIFDKIAVGYTITFIKDLNDKFRICCLEKSI